MNVSKVDNFTKLAKQNDQENDFGEVVGGRKRVGVGGEAGGGGGGRGGAEVDAGNAEEKKEEEEGEEEEEMPKKWTDYRTKPGFFDTSNHLDSNKPGIK